MSQSETLASRDLRLPPAGHGSSPLAARGRPASAAPHLTLKSICRVKGQEENTLQGLGIVVGLKGTGDGGSYLPTIRSVAKVMTVMGNAAGQERRWPS